MSNQEIVITFQGKIRLKPHIKITEWRSDVVGDMALSSLIAHLGFDSPQVVDVALTEKEVDKPFDIYQLKTDLYTQAWKRICTTELDDPHLGQAAPDLYAACNQALTALRRARDMQPAEWDDLVTTDLADAWDALKQAVKKAEGQSV